MTKQGNQYDVQFIKENDIKATPAIFIQEKGKRRALYY